MLDKTFTPAEMEARLYDAWEKGGYFKPGRKPKAAPYTIVIPPPNVTGSLHMGHALNNTIQDILIRFERMRGRDVLWQPGTDHAGIATQMVVERLLAKEGNIDRRSMGREAFLKRVWQWKEESGGIISQQLRRLGASCDWSRERFTMDEGLSKAVLKVFVQLYKEGLIYGCRPRSAPSRLYLWMVPSMGSVRVGTGGNLRAAAALRNWERLASVAAGGGRADRPWRPVRRRATVVHAGEPGGPHDDDRRGEAARAPQGTRRPHRAHRRRRAAHRDLARARRGRWRDDVGVRDAARRRRLLHQ